MIKETIFKGEKAIIIESEALKVVILPNIGGKIASIYHKEKDFEVLFQNQEDTYKKAQLNSNFGEFDASGFDDCFPTIDESKVMVAGKEVMYPDHGEVWSSTLNYTLLEEAALLTMSSEILPYQYSKEVKVQGEEVLLNYHIKNTGNFRFPDIWAMHCLVNCEEDMTINFPEDTKAVENVHESKVLGKVGATYNYPIDTTANGTNFDFRRINSVEAKNTEKYYVAHKAEAGSCSMYYPSKDLIFEIQYDSDKLPYLGFWVTEGGFRGDYNCALEPTNGYYDRIDIALNKEKCHYLEAGESLIFQIKIRIK